MKIFNSSKGYEEVYVQIRDILKISEHGICPPESAFEKIHGNEYHSYLILDKKMKDSFISFDKPKDIEFFRSIDWIVDYKNIVTYPIRSIESTINSIAKEKESFPVTCGEYDILDYKQKGFEEIANLKKGQGTISLPIEPDSDNFEYTNGEYTLSYSLAPNTLLIYRNDGKDIDEDYYMVSQKFECKAWINSAMDFSLDSSEMDEIISKSEDNKYVIIEMRYNPEKVIREEQKQPLIKKLWNKIIGKK